MGRIMAIMSKPANSDSETCKTRSTNNLVQLRDWQVDMEEVTDEDESVEERGE